MISWHHEQTVNDRTVRDRTVQDRMTPEERLLRVIENKGDPLPELRPSPWRLLRTGSLSHLKFSWPNVQAVFPKQPLGLEMLNRVLIGGIAVGLVVASINIVAFKPTSAGAFNPRTENAADRYPSLPVQTPLETYLSLLMKRDWFQNSSTQPDKTQTKSESAVLPWDLGQLVENLQLVGIAWGEAPEAMIRDKKEGRTHFLKAGQTFKGITIKEVFKDRVVLEYDGKTKELL